MDIKELYDNGDYEAVCGFWDEHTKTENAEPLNEWEYLFCMNSLYKKERYADCLRVYKEGHGAHPESDKLQGKMGWCLYKLHIKEHDFKKGDNDKYFRQVEYVLQNCAVSDSYSAVPTVLKHAVKAILSGEYDKNIDYARADRYLDAVQPEQLSAEPRSFEKNGKRMSFASPRESWFADKAKVLLKLGRYEECIACCDKAFEEIKHFHNNEDTWLRDKKIKSLMALDRLQEAEQVLSLILQGRVCHWAVYQDAYRIAVLKGDTEKAEKYIALAACMDRMHEMRVALYAEAAQFFHNKGKEGAAALHRRLVEAIREEKGWKEQKWEWELPKEVAALDKKAVLQKLEAGWKKWSLLGREFFEGTVKTVLTSGRSGFILDAQGKEHYFSMNRVLCGRNQLQAGTPVRFALEQHENPKTHKPEMNAVDITVK